MFKRFVPSEDVSSVTAVKTSVVRAMKRSICDTYPAIEEFIDDILPKKGDAEVKEGKGKDRLTFLVVNGEPLFFRVREGPYFPTLKLLHKCAWRCVLLCRPFFNFLTPTRFSPRQTP